MTVADPTDGLPAREQTAWLDGLMTVADLTYGVTAQETTAGWRA
jgi:hypothetical protein